MGLTVHYRGRLADMSRIEEFEDRVLDLVLEIGGTARIWRSAADDDPSRMIRGVLATLAPGQETTCLLVSPEGWLISFIQIKEAEQGLLEEPPWCWVKTQFGPVEGHVALVELLRALDAEFLAELEVMDEGDYWETRDLPTLIEKHAFLQDAIDGLAAGLRQHGLSAEAAEDPEILIRRIERIAEQVHRTISRPSEHPDPLSRDDDESDPDAVEAQWDALFRHNRRNQERMHRALEERLQQGEPHEEALENAMRDVGIPVPGDPRIDEYDEDDEDWFDSDAELDVDDEWESTGEEWKESVAEDDKSPGPFDRERHPLLERAMDLLHRLHDEFKDQLSEQESSLETLFQGAGDLMGGLSQATARYSDDEVEALDVHLLGLHVVQLKRALRGAAFARCALFQFRDTVPRPTLDELHETLKNMENDVFQLLSEKRAAMRGDG